MSHLLLTGRLPHLSIAELEALYGPKNVTPIGDHALVDADVEFLRLGGSIKMADHLATVDSANPQKVFDYARKSLSEFVATMPEGKIKLGVSLYGLSMPLQKQNANTLSLKKVIKNLGRSVRAVPNTEAALTSAQTYHNSMTLATGLELVFVSDGTQTHIGRVTNVQNIESYTKRDRVRPKRDAFVGMLPPKLAQTMVNIATGSTTDNRVVLDPFCGTGVILQEAALMGYSVYGTDVSEKMIRYSRDNLNWAEHEYKIRAEWQLEVADATTHIWRLPVDAVAGEGYLGQPLGGIQPTAEKLEKIMHECQTIMHGFLKNIAPQLPSGTRLCIAVPAWAVNDGLRELPLIDQLEELGYTWQAFTHVDATSLHYSREDQVTHRHLLPIIRS